MTIQVFGHKSPDTDSTGSPIIWAWYLSQVRGQPAEPRLQGEPNTEAAFVLNRWGFEQVAFTNAHARARAWGLVDLRYFCSFWRPLEEDAVHPKITPRFFASSRGSTVGRISAGGQRGNNCHATQIN